MIEVVLTYVGLFFAALAVCSVLLTVVFGVPFEMGERSATKRIERRARERNETEEDYHG